MPNDDVDFDVFKLMVFERILWCYGMNIVTLFDIWLWFIFPFALLVNHFEPTALWKM